MAHEKNLYFYRGNSMKGAFQRGDCLTVAPTDLVHIQRGDIIVFQISPDEEAPIVHRVVGIRPDGLITRGDNNRCVDEGMVTAANLLGRVTHFARKNIRYPVRGGRAGVIQGCFLHSWHTLRKCLGLAIIKVAYLPYHWLKQSGILHRLWQPPTTTIEIMTECGPLIKYRYGGLTIAHWWPQQNRFECRRPFDLFISRPHAR